MGDICVLESSPAPWSKIGRTVIVFTVLLQNRDVIQMAVVVENQSVDLKKKGQIFWKLLQASQLGSCLCQVCNSFFVTGQAFQEIL